MDNGEMAISQIKSLRMVHFYHIVKDNDYIDAVLAYYDKDKVINLCVLDKHYEKLLDKIWNVYEQEKGSNQIILDDYSRKVLEGAVTYDISHYENLTKGYVKIDTPVFPQNGYMNNYVVPIMRFILNQLYVMTGQEIIWNSFGRDWFGTGEIAGHCGEKKTLFPYRITMMGEGKYSVDIGNVLMSGNKLNIGMVFNEEGIELVIHSDKYPVQGCIKYLFAEDAMVCIADIMIEGKRVFSDTSKVEEEQERHWRLPWGQIATKVDNLVEYSFSNDEIDCSYVISFDEIKPDEKITYTIYNYLMSVFKSKRTDSRTQIHFSEMGYRTRGYYKSNLEGSYYIELME